MIIKKDSKDFADNQHCDHGKLVDFKIIQNLI